MLFSVPKPTITQVAGILFFIGNMFLSQAQGPELTPRERDLLKSQSIALVKELEQLLNVLAQKSTTTSDAQDLVALATEDEQTKIFYDPTVTLEDDIYSWNADSLAPKDVSARKYLNDWDLFYTKGYEETVHFTDLRVSDFSKKGYLYLRVFYQSQLKNKHKDFDRSYRTTRRIANIRFEMKDGKYKGYINGISFFHSKFRGGNKLSEASLEEEFKPFVKEHKLKLGHLMDSTITESQIAQLRKNDSLYVLAVKSLMQKSEEQQQQEQAYTLAIEKGEQAVLKKDFAAAIESFTEARTIKPLETYPRTKINELTRLLAGGATSPKQMFHKQMAEGDQFLKQRDYESARQAFQAAYIIMPDNPEVIEKFHFTDKVLRNKLELRRLYAAGNYKLALKKYAQIIAEDKTNPNYYFERARCYQSMGDNKKALVDLNSAIDLDPNFSEALEMRAATFQQLKDLARAMADYSTLIRIDPKIGEYYLRMGQLMALNNQPNQAIAEFDRALAIDPANVQAATAKAEAYRKGKNYEGAITAADFALSINPNHSSALFQKGMAFLEKGDEERAGKEFQKAYRLGLNVDEAQMLDSYFTGFFKSAREAAKKNQTEETLKWGEKALLVNPNSVDAHYFIAGQKLVLGKTLAAINHLDQCIFFNENYAPAYVKKGQIMLGKKDFKAAKGFFQNAYTLDNASEAACQGLGDIFVARNQYDSALVWFNKAFSIKSADAMNLLNRGKCHFIMENYHKALLDVENAIREDNQLAEAYFYKGKINRALKQAFNAIDNYNEAKKLGFHPYDCNLEIGQAYLSVNSLKPALKAFSDAIASNPELSEGYIQRGLCYLKKEDFTHAMADLEQAIKFDSLVSNTDCSIELGFLKLRFYDLPGAEKNFSRVLGFDPNHPKGSYGMAVVLFLQGKKEESMHSFDLAFQSGKIDYQAIKKEPWMQNILNDRDFIKVKEVYFK